MTLGTRTRAHAPAHIEAFGAASASLRAALDAPRRPARVLAVFPLGIYLEVRTDVEPSVLAVITGEATRLPNAVVLADPLPRAVAGDEAAVGDGGIEIGRVTVRVRRWWDPAPPLGTVALERLAAVLPRFDEVCAASSRRPGLDADGCPALLAQGCADGSLVSAISAAEQLMGLGPGLTPSGDDMLAGVLVALRRLGEAAGVDRAVWLADWLAATVAFDARTRTTPISATLLHYAAQGEACADAVTVLRGVTGNHPLGPAVRRLLQLGHTSGADLAWGLRTGVAAVLALGEKARAGA
ncbi:hypothetical protein Ssi03_14200 [Sphaerisporangium siamense]|uniref:DUF2877 domain-containing protein n=1 Tax=Sphaerisporangium siamense TaxID=795645 RepID=A0A7W7DA70_9ACTN|nr:DUF2877 domain-containing protein [Sphaerisporangium siamense]MBB4702814.1 hypothetical protein [Sphaerisporangium siamense]GII83430.1 hypothetical protein Ssi03_14200 [Sphaerisporangium siamense]